MPKPTLPKQSRVISVTQLPERDFEPVFLRRGLLFPWLGQLPAVAKKAAGLLEVHFRNFSFWEGSRWNV